jgi:F-type H+-transporting ATPase subunit delta
MNAQQTLTASVTSAVELTKTEKKEIESMLTTMTGQQDIALECTVDPSILGGLRVEVGDWVLDTTVASQLTKLSNQLMRNS